MIEKEIAWVAGISPAIQALEGVLREIAPTNIPVLLAGESGTGKEMYANRVHFLSSHGDEPLLRVSCGSTDAGAFGSALGLNPGERVGSSGEACAYGTMFFDEIGELDDARQRDLVCALPDGDGASRRGLLKARVVSATNRNLDEEMRAGRFRSELYYRINGVCLRLPALRDRKEDIPMLTDFFLTKHADGLRRPRPSLSQRTLQSFMGYSWPGNIRELENVIKKIVALGDENLAIAELAAPVSQTRNIPVTTWREATR